MKLIQRSFVKTLKKRFSESTPLIQIVMGPRQVGKTTGVLQFLDSINISFHYANADDQLVASRDWLLLQWQTAKEKDTETLLVIDEIQKVDNWAETIKMLWDLQQREKSQIKLLLLGSSSLALKRGASESLAGRFELIPVYHWNYIESNEAQKMDIETYLKFGGYPKTYEFLDDYDRYIKYVKTSIIDRVLDKDILYSTNVKKPGLFKQAFEILACYPSQEISYRKLLGQLQDKGNTEIIKYYISLFESAFLIKTIPKFGTQDFKIKSSSPKIIPLAPCFYHIFSTNYEKEDFVFEASVGASLFQVSDELYYWRKNNDEIDFILRWRKYLFAIEVKSGRKKRRSGVTTFSKLYPEAKIIFITTENYCNFITSPKDFLLKFT